MKKRILLTITIIICVIVVIGLVCFFPKQPFEKLEASEIENATVLLNPPGETLEITDKEKLADLLRDVVVYNKDDSYSDYVGQAVVFNLMLTDGTNIKIMAYNPFIVINGKGYKTKYEPCEALNAYANMVLSENYELDFKDGINSFVGKVLEETTSYMIVEPVKDKADGDMGDKVKVEYGTDHYDYLFGEGRMVVIYFEGKPEETTDGMKLIKSDNISTEGFREFELEVEPSNEKQKRLALSGDDIQSFVSFGHMSDTNLYYYGLDKVMITIKGFTMPLETALEKGRITLDGIVANCNMDVINGVLEELVYKDGGSQVYKYPEYTIIKYHTLDGNRDVYIGSTDMDIQIANK